MKKLQFILALALLPATMSAVSAGEKFAATNYYVTDTKTWLTGEKTGYWMSKFTGVSQVLHGPVDTLAVECNGAGYWGTGGVSGNGICVHGTGDDTFVLRFEAQAGAKTNSWKILSGRGKYEGLVGEGTATTDKLPGNRRVSKLIGQMELRK